MYVHPLDIMEIMKLSTKLSEIKKDNSIKLNLEETKLLKNLVEVLEDNYKKISRFERYLKEPQRNGYYELLSQKEEILKSPNLEIVLNYCVLYNIIDYVSFEDEVAENRLYRIEFISAD